MSVTNVYETCKFFSLITQIHILFVYVLLIKKLNTKGSLRKETFFIGQAAIMLVGVKASMAQPLKKYVDFLAASHICEKKNTCTAKNFHGS